MLHCCLFLYRKGAKTLRGFCDLRVVCGEDIESFDSVNIDFIFVIISFDFVVVNCSCVIINFFSV